MARFSQPRELKPHERALLEFLLTAEFPGKSELQDQARHVQAIGDCDCGCGTIDMSFQEPATPPHNPERVVVEAHRDSPEGPIEVLLFVRDGLLSSLEIVDYLDTRLYPTPDQLKLWVPPRGKSRP